MYAKLQNIRVQPLPHFSDEQVQTDILRLDLLHPVVSGNKWFKLKYYLEDARQTGHHTIATFGGAFSNHIVAMAYAAKEAGLQSCGYIRGELSHLLSPTLWQSQELGMELKFVTREQFRDPATIIRANNDPGVYWVREGGYGPLGAKGAGDILSSANTQTYTHIICAVGTGTMLAGLVQSAGIEQQLIGISVLKNHLGLEQEVKSLLNNSQQAPFTILHNYHFGGYAKHPAELIRFMCETWEAEQLPTDIVYTSKLLYAVKELVSNQYFPAGSRLLVIHSGGIQGNNSLPPGLLPFS
ncbi:MAG TPA: pyridoxal-phosphate dependent enzyme [Sediminibacterium sp.]